MINEKNMKHFEYPEIKNMIEDNIEVWQIIDEFKNIFRNELSNELSSYHTLNYHIDMNMIISINHNIYLLSI